MNHPSPLTICLFSNLYPPVLSGSSTYCSELARGLVRLGCKVVVITSKVDADSPDFETEAGVLVYRLPCLMLPRMAIAINFPWLNISYFPANSRRIQKILIDHQPDIIHLSNHMFDMALHGIGMSRRLKIPLVISVHTIIKHMNPFYDSLLHFVDRCVLGHLVIRKADILICPDQAMVNYVSDTLGSNKTAIIPYGIDPPAEPDLKNVSIIRKRHGIEDGPVVLSLGHLNESRNRRELIQVLPALIRRYPKIKLLIVGYIGTQSTSRMAAKLGVQDQVIFTGMVPHSEMPDYLALADIEAHWFDARHPHKTIGITGLEAMAAGKVIIGNTEEDNYGKGVLRNGENAVLLNPGDTGLLFEKISELLDDEKKRNSIGDNAARTARVHFSWEAVCNKTIDIYRKIQSP